MSTPHQHIILQSLAEKLRLLFMSFIFNTNGTLYKAHLTYFHFLWGMQLPLRNKKKDKKAEGNNSRQGIHRKQVIDKNNTANSTTKSQNETSTTTKVLPKDLKIQQLAKKNHLKSPSYNSHKEAQRWTLSFHIIKYPSIPFHLTPPIL